MLTPGRQCGNCTACCKTLAVRELHKAANEWCAHCTKGVGCQTYTVRPQECRDFECAWLQGALKDGDRPDKLRAVLWTARFTLPSGRRIDVLNVCELSPHARERARVNEIGRDAAKTGALVLFWPPKVGSPPAVGRLPEAASTKPLSNNEIAMIVEELYQQRKAVRLVLPE